MTRVLTLYKCLTEYSSASLFHDTEVFTLMCVHGYDRTLEIPKPQFE